MVRLRLVLLAAVAIAAASCATTPTLTPPPARNAVPPIDAKNVRRVIVLVLENGSPVEAARQPFAQFLEQRGTRLDQYFGVAHPSQPNYIAMISGSTAGALTNDPVTLDRPHIGEFLGDRWRVYAEDYPAIAGKCNLVRWSGAGIGGKYVRRHVPFLSFRDVQSGDCAQIVRLNQPGRPIAALDDDIRNGTLPDFALIIPNLTHDAHAPSNLATANAWLVQNIQPLFADPKFTDGTVFVLTFDEDDTEGRPNRVYTVIAGDAVKRGVSTDVYDHEDLLATIAALLHVPWTAYDEPGVRPIGGIWR